MDSASTYALSYSLIIIAIVGALLYMTRPPSVGPEYPVGEVGKKYGNLAAVIVPYALIGFGPFVDLYYREFKYSILTVIGAASVVVGYGYQYALHGSSSFLPALTIATSAVVSFLVYDVWVQGSGKMFATVLGALVIWAQANTNVSTTIFASKSTNDAVAVFLGLALGALSWLIVWNSDKKYLFQTPTSNKAK